MQREEFSTAREVHVTERLEVAGWAPYRRRASVDGT